METEAQVASGLLNVTQLKDMSRTPVKVFRAKHRFTVELSPCLPPQMENPSMVGARLMTSPLIREGQTLTSVEMVEQPLPSLCPAFYAFENIRMSCHENDISGHKYPLESQCPAAQLVRAIFCIS